MNKFLLTVVIFALFFSQCHIEIPGVPEAAFTIENNNCMATCEVVFTAASKNASSYLWDFGDGTTSTEANPKHIYTVPKTYQVRFIAKGKGGSSGSTQTVTINIPIPPVAAFSITNNGCTVPCNVSFNNQSTNANSFQWDFGENTGSNQTSPSKQYTQGGTYTVKLTANGYGGSNSRQQTVTVVESIPTKVWDKTFGGSLIDNVNSNEELYNGGFSLIGTSATAAAPDGGYLLMGTSYSAASADKSENSRGRSDYWVVKFNANGTKIWDKTFGGTGYEIASSIVAAPDGGFLLVGYSDSPISGEKSENAKGRSDYWVVKINANGVKMWDKTLGGSEAEVAPSVAAASDGGFVMAGYSYSGQSGDKTENTKGGADYWVVKINSTGTKVWDKTVGGSNGDYAPSILAASDGGFLVAGYSDSNTSWDKSENSRGETDYWMVKINANGAKVWDKTLGGSGKEYNPTAVVTIDGGYMVVGTSFSNQSGDKTEGSKGDADYWVIKINANGSKVWDKTLGGNAYDSGRAVVATPYGGFVFIGDSDSGISSDKSENRRGKRDWWVVKINSSGVKVWDKTFGGSAYNVSNSLLATPDGGFLLTGESDSFQSGDKSENSKGGSDLWAIKIN